MWAAPSPGLPDYGCNVTSCLKLLLPKLETASAPMMLPDAVNAIFMTGTFENDEVTFRVYQLLLSTRPKQEETLVQGKKCKF